MSPSQDRPAALKDLQDNPLTPSGEAFRNNNRIIEAAANLGAAEFSALNQNERWIVLDKLDTYRKFLDSLRTHEGWWTRRYRRLAGEAGILVAGLAATIGSTAITPELAYLGWGAIFATGYSLADNTAGSVFRHTAQRPLLATLQEIDKLVELIET